METPPPRPVPWPRGSVVLDLVGASTAAHVLRAIGNARSIELDSRDGTVTLHGVPADQFADVVLALVAVRRAAADAPP